MIVAFFWVFSRESNAWAALTIASVTFVAGIWKHPARRYLFCLSGIFVTLFIANEVSSQLGRRWLLPFQNILAQRILPSEEATSYFVRCGMPGGPGLRHLSGQRAGGVAGAEFHDPDLGDYQIWLHGRGKGCYLRWLISNPQIMLLQPLANLREILGFEGKIYFAEGFSPILPRALESFIYPLTQSHWLYGFAVLCCAAAIAGVLGQKLIIRFGGPRRRLLTDSDNELPTQDTSSMRRENTHWSLPIAAILLTYPNAIVVWHGDAVEVGRHSLAIGVQFYLGLWMLLLFVIDFMFCRGSRRKLGPIASERVAECPARSERPSSP